MMIAFAASGILSPVAIAAGFDLHNMWHDRCAECHGHSGAFARKFLSVSEGKLLGHHHVHDLRQFLTNHYAPDHEVDAIYRMLWAQASSPPRFEEECKCCHDLAANFVRNSLYFCDEGLCGRESQQPIHRFLARHRKLTSEDVEFFTRVLDRVANEVYRP
jgi:hypothetical protein